MMRFFRALVLLAAFASLAACARGPKQPWGWVREPVNKTTPSGVVVLPGAGGPTPVEEEGKS